MECTFVVWEEGRGRMAEAQVQPTLIKVKGNGTVTHISGFILFILHLYIV